MPSRAGITFVLGIPIGLVLGRSRVDANRNVAVLWVPAPMKGKKAAAKITKISQLAGHRIGVVGRTPANIDLLKVILAQYRVDPSKVDVVQFPVTEAADDLVAGDRWRIGSAGLRLHPLPELRQPHADTLCRCPLSEARTTMVR